MANPIELYQWEISPYCEKIRKILDYKKIPYVTLEQPLPRRPKLVKETGQQKVPVIQDGGRWIADSTDIAIYLEDKFPQPSIIPSDPRDRALALLIEDWADEAFASTVQPVKWLTPGNMDRLLAEMQRAMPGALNSVLLRVSRPVLTRQMQGLTHGRGMKRTRVLLGHQLDLLENLMGDNPYFFGETPGIADFSVAALVHHLRGLDGWEEVTRRRRLLAMLDRIEGIPSTRTGRK